MAIKAVFFDVGNTLLFLNHAVVLRPLHEQCVYPTPDLLLETERETKREFDCLQGHAAVDRGFWQIYYSRLLERLDISSDGIHDELVALTRMSSNWCRIRPNTHDVLKRLREKFRLGVISNADGKIAEVLTHCGIADCFDTITDSGIVGHEKPHPAIFEAAVKSLGVAASESIYTGDVYSVDYVGSTNAGMQCVMFDVSGAYESHGLPRVESLERLELMLESI